MAPHSSTLAWKIPWMEEPGRLQSMGSLRVRHDCVTSLSFSLSCTKEGNGNPLQCSCLENPRHWGAWWAAVYGVAQSQTRLKRLSSSSNSQEGKVLIPRFIFHSLRSRYNFFSAINNKGFKSHITRRSGLIVFLCVFFFFTAAVNNDHKHSSMG